PPCRRRDLLLPDTLRVRDVATVAVAASGRVQPCDQPAPRFARSVHVVDRPERRRVERSPSFGHLGAHLVDARLALGRLLDPGAPSPYALRTTIAKHGTFSRAPLTNMRPALRTRPDFSASGPTMKPGVSHSDRTGSPKVSARARKRAAFSDASASIAPARCAGL